jgi:hypothetical protein
VAALPTEETQARQLVIADAFQDIAAGLSIREIAAKYGIPKSSMHRMLLADHGDKYKQVQELGLIQRLIESEEELDDARNLQDISKAREKIRSAQWTLNHLSKRFSPKAEIAATVTTNEATIPEAARRIAFIMQRSGIVIDAQIADTPNTENQTQNETHQQNETNETQQDGKRV